MKFLFRAYGNTNDGGGFPASDNPDKTLQGAIGTLNRGFSRGQGWVEVFTAGSRLAVCHLVYSQGKLVKTYKFKG